MAATTPSFESYILAPILALNAEFVTTPSKRVSAPLPKRKPALRDNNNNNNNNGVANFGERYVDKLRHSLLHETFQAVGSDFDERDAVFGKINLLVNSFELNKQSWVLRCSVSVGVVQKITRQMSKSGLKRGKGKRSRVITDAEFFIRDNSLGIVRKKSGEPILAAITCLKRYIKPNLALVILLSRILLIIYLDICNFLVRICPTVVRWLSVMICGG